MNKTEETALKMAKLLSSQSNNNQDLENESINLTSEESEWVQVNLPSVDKNQVLVYVNYENSKILVCLEELDWVTFQDIEASSYRKRIIKESANVSEKDPNIKLLFKESENENKIIFYSGEYECRNILSNAILWVADITSKELMQNKNKQILTKLPHSVISIVWEKFSKVMTLSLKEANALYSAALAYFKGDVEKKPIPSTIILVDMIIKLGRLSKDDIEKIKYSEMERIKLILKARSEALRLINTPTSVETPKENVDLSVFGLPH